jgi:hypothetical protein
MVVHHVEVESIAIQVVATYVLHVLMDKNQTQIKIVVRICVIYQTIMRNVQNFV